jgi:hypothetical protein
VIVHPQDEFFLVHVRSLIGQADVGHDVAVDGFNADNDDIVRTRRLRTKLT